MYLAISQQQGYQGFFEYGAYFFKTLVYGFFTVQLAKKYNVSINVKCLRIPIIK